MLEGLRKPAELIFLVVGLLSYGCPLQAIVHVFGLDERTVAAWRDRAGQQCQRVQQALVEQGQLTLTHVQADEIRVRGKKEVFWMGLAMEVSSRLWLAGMVQAARDPRLGRSPLEKSPSLCLWSQSTPDLCRWMDVLSCGHFPCF
jgi:hypothetical protein